MKRNPLPTRLAVSMITRLFTIALIAQTAACDDYFLFPLCGDGTPSKCMEPPPAMQADMMADIAPPPGITDLRKFDSPVKIDFFRRVGPNTQFVGFNGSDVLLLIDGFPQIIASVRPDITTGNISLNPPFGDYSKNTDVSKMTFAQDRILRAGEFLILFTNTSSPDAKVIAPESANFPPIQTTAWFRHFTHPIFDAMAIKRKAAGSAFVQFNYNTKLSISAPTVEFSSFAIGNIDAIDNNNTLEFIAHDTKGTVSHVIHQNSIPDDTNDVDLAKALSAGIARASGNTTGPIQAAFVSDINNDGYQEYVFSRANNIFIVTYKGRAWLNYGASFESWKPHHINLLTDENVAAIFLRDMNNDGLPDLIIETNKAIYFHKNIPA